VLASLSLLACVPSTDPLLYQRQALAEQGPLDPSWAAQASLALDLDVVSSWIADGVTAELSELSDTFTLPGGVLGDLVMSQALTVAPIEVAVAGQQLHVETAIEGQVEVVLDTLLGRAAETFSWTGTFLAAYEVVLNDHAIVARPHETEHWGLELVLGESFDVLDETLGVLFEEAMRGSLSASPPEPRVLAELPDDTVRALRLRPGADALVVDFAFRIQHPGEVHHVPHPAGGFVAVLPELTALGLAQAAVLAEGPADEVVEPVSLSLDGSHFSLGVRHHVPSAFKPRRGYTLEGELVLEDGELVVRPLAVEALGGVAKAKLSEDHRVGLLADLTAALTVSLPAKSTAWVAGEDRPIEAVRLDASDGQLVVWGAVGQ
jgi:hypothetical protein